MHRPAFLRHTAAALGVLMAQMGAASFAELSREYGPGRKSHKRLTNGTPSKTFVRRTRQMERAEFRQRNKGMYRAIREGVRADRKRRGRDVPSINEHMIGYGL